MVVANQWKDYELLDSGSGDKLERWGNIILRRPDPQIIWPIKDENGQWKKADARYHRSKPVVANGNFTKSYPKDGR